MPKVQLPKIQAQSNLVKPRDISSGDVSHVRWEFAGEKPTYALVPTQIAKKWHRRGVTFRPQLVTQGLNPPDQDFLGDFAAIRVRFGPEKQKTHNFYVPIGTAQQWLETAKRFERLLEDYQSIMAGG